MRDIAAVIAGRKSLPLFAFSVAMSHPNMENYFTHRAPLTMFAALARSTRVVPHYN